MNGHIFLGADTLGDRNGRRHCRAVETWREECAERTERVVFPDETGRSFWLKQDLYIKTPSGTTEPAGSSLVNVAHWGVSWSSDASAAGGFTGARDHTRRCWKRNTIELQSNLLHRDS